MSTDKLVRRSGVKLHIAVKSEAQIEYTGSITGTFVHGETVTGGTSNATGVFLHADTTNSHIYLLGVSGTFQDGETLTGGTSSASVSAAASSAVDATGVFTPYVRNAKPQGQIQVSDSRGVTTIVDFDSTESDYADKITDAREGNVNWTSNTALDDEGQLMARTAYQNNATVRVKRVRTTIDGLTTETLEWEGFFSNNSETDQDSGVSTNAKQLEITAEGPFA